MCQKTIASPEILRTRSAMIKQVSELIKTVKADFIAFALLLRRYCICVVYIVVTGWSSSVGSLLVHFIMLKHLVRVCSIQFSVIAIRVNDKKRGSAAISSFGLLLGRPHTYEMFLEGLRKSIKNYTQETRFRIH